MLVGGRALHRAVCRRGKALACEAMMAFFTCEIVLCVCMHAVGLALVGLG